jgi:hypothetical protein
MLRQVAKQVKKHTMEMEFKQSSFCFGHGVGAHVCGIAGLSFERLNHMNSDKYQSEYDRPICEYPGGKRRGTPMFTGIIAMDPAGPIFETNSIDFRLDRCDAGWVEVVHTHTMQHGYATPLGDVDFYANGGEVQPNCHPIYDPQCSIGSAYKLLTHHYNVHVKCATNVICDSRNFPTHPSEIQPECKKLQKYEDLQKKAVAVADLENIVKIAHGYHPPKMDHGPNVMWLDTTRGGVTHLIMGPTAGPTCYYPPHSDVH